MTIKKKPYKTNQSSIRQDGKTEFSARSRALADKRRKSGSGSRIQKKLGRDDVFTSEFKTAFDPDTEYEQILGSVYLERELDAARKTITALRKFPNDGNCQRILKQMQSKPFRRKKDCPLCPIWRHERQTALTLAARSRYVFPRVQGELFLVSVIYDFAENLVQLEQSLADANKSMSELAAYMGRKRHGVMMVGTFEFDLLSRVQLTTDHKSKALLSELGITASESGGWSLTGHFFVRVPHRDVMEGWLRKRYPSSDPAWVRVRFDKIKGKKKLEDDLSRIISYSGKPVKALFSPPTRDTKGKKRREANDLMQTMSAAFYGTTMNTHIDEASFNLNAAIAQWAKFIDRVGASQVYYSVETTHAQKWYSESEMDYLRLTDDDLFGDGRHLIEIHRDCGHFSPNRVLPHLKGRTRSLRTRSLTYDAEWEAMTDCHGIDSDTHYHDFDRWMLKP